MRAPIQAVAVIIPAHDEEADVDAAMHSVSAAAKCSGLPTVAVMVLDACTDRTEEVVRHRMQDDRSVEWLCVAAAVRRASSSREVGLQSIVAVMADRCAFDRIAVLSTDADSVVPRSWVVDHVRHLDVGDDAVAGVVDLAPDPGDVSYELWRAEYTALFRPDGWHPHVHCANLAVRLDVLIAAGGFGHLKRAEDIDLWRRIQALTTTTVRCDQASIVRTSHRLEGRVDGGFATALRQFRPALH